MAGHLQLGAWFLRNVGFGVLSRLHAFPLRQKVGGVGHGTARAGIIVAVSSCGMGPKVERPPRLGQLFPKCSGQIIISHFPRFLTRLANDVLYMCPSPPSAEWFIF